MSLTGLDHFISLSKAIDMTSRYRSEKENIIDPTYRNDGLLLQSETFDREAFEALLNSNGCAGIRAYFGMDTDLKVRVLFVAVNNENEDMLPSGGTGTDLKIVEAGQSCPVVCPPASPLNED